MICARCKSKTLTKGSTTFTIERGNLLLVVRHVPALICNQCGEEFVEGSTHERLEDLAVQAKREGAQVLVREYGEAVSA